MVLLFHTYRRLTCLIKDPLETNSLIVDPMETDMPDRKHIGDLQMLHW